MTRMASQVRQRGRLILTGWQETAFEHKHGLPAWKGELW